MKGLLSSIGVIFILQGWRISPIKKYADSIFENSTFSKYLFETKKHIWYDETCNEKEKNITHSNNKNIN